MSVCVFVVDDDPNMLNYMRTLLQLQACNVQTAASGQSAIEQLQQGLSPDLIFLDLMMPGMDGLQTLERLRTIDPHLPVIMFSHLKDTGKVVEAMRLGAVDFLNKPLDGAAVEQILQRHVRKTEAGKNNPDEEVEHLPGGALYIAGSPQTRRIHSQIAQIAEFDVPVLFLGESGVGKEMAALLLHKLSNRRSGPFLKVNCAAIPSELLESELFGYEAGAFTGAMHSHPGKFESCNGGTILLDEIGEMPPSLQAKLLQVLQEQRFFRLGGRSAVTVDVRILAATNVNIEEAIKKGKVRLDLYYRLNAFAIHLPPLRERREEIPVLMAHFIDALAARYGRPVRPVSREMTEACMQHSWPGNVRELHNFVKRWVVLGDEPAILNEFRAPRNLAHIAIPHDAKGKDLKEMVRDLKRQAEAQAIAQVLQQTNWNRREAAAILNISYKALTYKCRQYGLGLEPGPGSDCSSERES